MDKAGHAWAMQDMHGCRMADKLRDGEELSDAMYAAWYLREYIPERQRRSQGKWAVPPRKKPHPSRRGVKQAHQLKRKEDKKNSAAKRLDRISFVR